RPGGVEVRLVGTGRHEPFLFAIFRTSDGQVSFDDARNLVAVVPGGRQARWTDPDGKKGDQYYAVAVDRVGRTSKPSHGFRVV
ncbi:MAG: glycosyl hydrolase, partial [Nonomuraea sp.]|nr:glycosyl hydrolase [Nonomuraea sp.]